MTGFSRRSFVAAGLAGAFTLASRTSWTAVPAKEKDGFVYLEGGNVWIGSPQAERQRNADEVRHQVVLSPFFIDPCEVCQADYEEVMETNPSERKGKNLPVEHVSWLDAVNYCNALSLKRGLQPVYRIEGEAVAWDRSADGYRLLTEVEWEYAARAGTESIFNIGNQTNPDQINYQGNYPYLIEENYVVQRDPSVRAGLNRGRMVPVGSLPANAFGLHEMHGNAAEWVFDYYAAYDLDDKIDPCGPQKGRCRVARGGGYNDFAKHVRCAYRSALNPLTKDRNLGFRLARNARPNDSVVHTQVSERIQMPENPRAIVVYFSYSGNTRDAAQYIAERIGARLFPIAMQEPYHGEIYEASQIDMNANARPALASKLENIDDYDVVLLGYPTWWATVPPPVFSFVESTKLAGKIILPFSSHGSTDFGESLSELAKAVPYSYVGQGFEFYYSGGRHLNERIDRWLSQNGLLASS